MNLDPFQNPARFNHVTVKWRGPVSITALVTMAINPGVPGYDGKIPMISLEGWIVPMDYIPED